MNRESKLIVVAGPTASGKTDYAVKLAKELNGEIVNADSRQVYKHMSIGTNKGNLKLLGSTNEELRGLVEPYEIENSGVVGWLFDIVEPDQDFSLADYQVLARKVIKNINSRNKPAILVGGTGLYIDAVVRNYDMDEVSPDPELRKKLAKLSVEELQEVLKKLDKGFFDNLNNSEKNNPRRLLRMIEKLTAGKYPKKQQIEKPEFEMIYLDLPKEELYRKIDARAEAMFREGFVEEVKKLIKMGYKNTKPLQSMGYKEVLDYLDGKLTLEECIEKTKRAHRNYAKRQVTWFSRPPTGKRNDK